MYGPARNPDTQRTPVNASTPVYPYELVREFPHDVGAFTQGLIFRDGVLYESTGLTGHSSLRSVRLETGEIIRRHRIDDRYFAEGLTEWRGELVQLTPMRDVPTVPATLAHIGEPSFFLPAIRRRLGGNIGISYDIASFEPRSTFSYAGEGWGLTTDGRRLIMSDGSSYLRFLDPRTFHELGRIQVSDRGRPIDHLNELELVDDRIYANIWFEDRIAIIRPDSGAVTAWIDLSDLASRMTPRPDQSAGAVLNGIAYDTPTGRLFVTGKRWPRVFEIRVRPPA
jgi:glutamine cyclotransferase